MHSRKRVHFLYLMIIFSLKRGRKCGVPEKACFLGCYLIAAQVVDVVVLIKYILCNVLLLNNESINLLLWQVIRIQLRWRPNLFWQTMEIHIFSRTTRHRDLTDWTQKWEHSPSRDGGIFQSNQDITTSIGFQRFMNRRLDHILTASQTHCITRSIGVGNARFSHFQIGHSYRAECVDRILIGRSRTSTLA